MISCLKRPALAAAAAASEESCWRLREVCRSQVGRCSLYSALIQLQWLMPRAVKRAVNELSPATTRALFASSDNLSCDNKALNKSASISFFYSFLFSLRLSSRLSLMLVFFLVPWLIDCMHLQVVTGLHLR